MSVVNVDDGHAIISQILRKEQLLGFEVGIHRLVVIEMVLRQVAKETASELDTSNTALVERMRRRFHHEVGAAFSYSARCKFIKVQKTRSRKRSRHGLVANLILDGAEQSRFAAFSFEHRIHEERTSRLAVRTRNGMANKLAKRILVENPSGFQAGSLHVRHLDPLRRESLGSHRLAHNRNGTSRNSATGERFKAFRWNGEE